ncbi:LysR family transcriptional regulator [Streptomyces drozdowiczii]|uniref:LysR family transcriptional regulator n=1 Tax=Streptomyces drozdowiczii TaxID=202862 RepID=A0ABY6Q1J8_9ACTN|nr:LysR family transcriptional regulator [Streptomyces drozdowiczii]MCX0241938.1 LysR family transcriptional regulator [Streptomyces drozdowiczii]UZK57951.1 LysR family transcriptional regulator [Streptomyces drozdowiczii]
MELREIEIFLMLAEELHFGRTAERMRVTPARVSQVIKKQERAIGAELFKRTSRSVQLTPAGIVLRDGLAAGYQQIKEALASAVAVGRGITGELNVAYSAAWCGILVVAATDIFRARQPNCLVRIHESPLLDPIGPLRDGTYDIQLVELPIDEPDIVNGPVLFSEPRALVVPVGHPFARRGTVSLEDLSEAPLITVTGQPQYFLDHHYPHRTPEGRLIPRGPSTTAWQEVLALVGAGKGVSPTCARAAQYYSRPDVVYVPFSDAPLVEYGLLWTAANSTPKVQAFIETLLETARSSDLAGL